MPQTVFESLDAVRAAVGTTLGTSPWFEVTQERVDRFADATVRGERTGEAPGYLVLSLTNQVLPEVVEVRGASLGVNYGTGKVRFPSSVPVGSRVRGTAQLTACDEIAGGIQTTIVVTMEVEGGADPACVVESLSRWLA
jgi:acyl dehydratase